MSIPVFLSHPRPINNIQSDFIEKLSNKLSGSGFEPLTLGVNRYDMKAPLEGIITLMNNTYGLITVAFKRAHIKKGMDSPQTKHPKIISDKWLTSPYCQIETAMGYQSGLPVLILKEKGVLEEGVLEKGVTGGYISEIDLSESCDKYLNSNEFKGLLAQWKIAVMKQYGKDLNS